MEKSTILARLALFSVVCFLLFPLSSCTHDDQEEELYGIEAKASTQTTTSKSEEEKKEEEKKEEDFVDKKKIKLKKKKTKK